MRDKITMNTKYWRLKIQSFTRPEEKPHNFHGVMLMLLRQQYLIDDF